ncbi:serine protease svh-1-like isoform X2 [Diabrotica undecimpunctata]|uniref:serine protease svh-1-like isoform X2 n=1 Tax=Diabrotica undecimpunctata TaxID=50387 RepID=UPI003B63AAE8
MRSSLINMRDKDRIRTFFLFFGVLWISQICTGIIIPTQEQPRPAYSYGIKTASRKNTNPYMLQNYSRVVVHNRPDIPGAQYVRTHTEDIQHVYPVYNIQGNNQRVQRQNILQTQSHTKIDAGQFNRPNRTIIKRKIESKTLEIYTKCPPGVTGQFIYSASCNQFLNCWKGRGSVQNCAPGTLFNPKSLECDFPEKVECVTGPGSNTIENIRVQKSVLQASCPAGFSGIIPDYFDCSKFINCDNGQENKMACAPGTLFDMNKNMCDYPQSTTCFNGDNSLEVNSAGTQQHYQWSQGSTDGHNLCTSQNCQSGKPGYVIKPVEKSPDYDDVYNSNHYQRRPQVTTPRSAWPPPYQTADSNDLGETDYVFTYDNGDPVVLEPENVIEVKQRVTRKCSDDDFHCSANSCISLTLLCDNNRDCADGKDEQNCREYIERFSVAKNSRLVVVENQRIVNVSHSTCAVLCIQNKKFTCRSFTYRRSDRNCFLSDKNIGLSGALQTHHSSDYYELKDGTIDCSDKTKYFECNNKKCLTKDYVCDGYNDCDNREDEKHCGAEKFGYKIKLAGSDQKNEGRVEITAFESTGFICDDDFSILDANVICRELGFPLGAAEVKGQSYFAKDLKERNTLYMIDDLNCVGNESTVIDCTFPGWGMHNCRDQEIAGVVCKTPQEKCGSDKWKCDSGNECIPFEFVCDDVEDCNDDSDEAVQHCEAPTELRLVGGTYPGEGRVEIKHNGIWGTICDDDFNEDAAKVVCKSLGYKGRSFVKKDAFFGAGFGPIWLDQVSCYGNETELNTCTHWDWGEHNCEHSEDVGVICSQDAIDVQIERHSNLPTRIEEGLPKNCGFRKDNQFAINDLVQARVIGGGVAKKGDYPWQAALKVRVKDKSAHWCGAIIISSRWVLTAAHCLQGYTKGAYVIVAGDYNTDDNDGTEQQKYIDEFFVHEQFRKGHKLNNDIALIKVKGTGFVLNDDVQPICLADATTDYSKQMNCTISGFGSIKSGVSAYSHNLLSAWISTYSDDICKMPHVYGDVLTNGMFCAGSMDGAMDACDGDSGGPLACLDQGVFTLYGITSWGMHCGYANKPGVYVKVGHYRKWIDDTIAKHSR